MTATSVPTLRQADVAPAPSWVTWVTLALSLVGLALATYLTITHFDPRVLACSGHGLVNCGAVTTSPQSAFLGIPVAFLGLAQYVAMATLCSPWAWRSRRREVHVVTFALFACTVATVPAMLGWWTER